MSEQTTTQGQETRITFEELVAHGIASGCPLVRGMPWSFSYNGYPVTHDTDDLYLVGGHPLVYFKRGEVLVTTADGRVFTETPGCTCGIPGPDGGAEMCNLHPEPSSPTPRSGGVTTCAICGVPATCHGTYQGLTAYACDEHCGHGNEDGSCAPVASPTPQPQPSGAERTTEPFAARTYLSAWQHSESGLAVLLTAEEWLREEADVYDSLDAAGEDDMDRDEQRGGIMRAIADEIVRLRAERQQFAEGYTARATPPAQPSGGVPTSLPTWEEVEQTMEAWESASHELSCDPDSVSGLRVWEAAAEKFRTLLQQLHAAAVRGAEDRERSLAVTEMFRGLPLPRKLIATLGLPDDAGAAAAIEAVVSLRADAEQWRALERESPEMAGAARRLIASVAQLRAARQPRPEGQGVEG